MLLRSTLLLSARLSLLPILSSTSVLHLPNFSADIISYWYPPIYFHNFLTTLSHRVSAGPPLHFPIQLYQLWLAISFFVNYGWHFNFFVTLCLAYHSQFCSKNLCYMSYLSIVVLRKLLSSVYCFQLFYEFRAFPSHTSPAYSSFATTNTHQNTSLKPVVEVQAC